MKMVPQIKLIFGLMILTLAACTPIVRANEIPTPTQVTGLDAQVQSVEIQVDKTDPVQVNAIVRGMQAAACTTFANTQLYSASNTFMIKLIMISHSDQDCTLVDTPFEQTIPLNNTDLPKGDYTVKVNGVSAVFTLPAGDSQDEDQNPSGEPGQKKFFRSEKYHYQVSYPADWDIKVDTSIPSIGKDPEYVNLSTHDASNLPQIDVWVQTDVAPMSGYENCEKNFVFRNLPACHISQQAGQIPAGELWIFQNGSAYFYIRMVYEDQSSLQVFDDFISSFEFFQSVE
jgi:hypothetical protein